jgi:TonB family protein
MVLAIAITIPTMAAALADQRPNMQPVPIGHIGQWFGPDNYPPDAVRSARQGRAVVTLQIDASGAVIGCSTFESSGTTILDTATCDIAMAHLRFDPATDAKGQPTAGTYRLPVRWVLPDTVVPAIDVTAGAPKDSLVEVELAFDSGGKILSCRSTVTDAPA